MSSPQMSEESRVTKSSSTSSRQTKKAQKVLACVLCQQRKKKCDRRSPCSNCIKLKAVCIPSTPAPPRKRRRPNQDLMERLARCEALLKHCTCIPKPLCEKLLSEQTSVTPPESPEADPVFSPNTDATSPK